ncbi:hypothetical protein M514_19936 [Trichuris suis]|uniref:GIY-YIG domain-containing protein n=1 Tax=Trichuris suis TaxID=68888 RepID=A0A085NEF7_9BILA|nr:hypothetical protein M514_19936 [Trichuris suis]
MKNVLTYRNAERRLNREPTTSPGRPPTVDPRKAMEKAIKASVVVEHASQCSIDPRPEIICRESLFHLRHIKEALYIKSNSTINRDNGVVVSEVWGVLLERTVYMQKINEVLKNPVYRPIKEDPTEKTRKALIRILDSFAGETQDLIRRLGHSLNFNVRFKSSCNLRSIVRSDKIKVPFDSRPGVVYEIKCGCNASYIGETGNTLFRRFDRHMKHALTYKNAERRLNGEPTIGPGRPPKIEPRKAIANAIKASVVVEHASQCSLDPRPKIICRESFFHLQRIKEALYIKSNSTINRDNGVANRERTLCEIRKFTKMT